MSNQRERNALYRALGSEVVCILKSTNAIVGGGAITSIFCKRDIADIDVYFRNSEDAISFLKKMYSKASVSGVTDKSVTFSLYYENRPNIQLIHFDYFENTDKLLNSFDFTVCMGIYDFKTESFILHPDFLLHNAGRELHVNKDTTFPLHSLLRVKKYEGKGYAISNSELLRLTLKCMSLNISTVDEFIEQTGGMYEEGVDIWFPVGEAFSLEKVIDYLGTIEIDQNRDPGKSAPIPSQAEIELLLLKNKLSYFEVPETMASNKQYYAVLENGTLRKIVKPHSKWNQTSIEDYFSTKRFYKYVQKTTDGKLCSYKHSRFRYVVGKVIACDTSPHLYFSDANDPSTLSYKSKRDKVLIEVLIDSNDFVSAGEKGIQSRSCYVVREVPKEEEAELLKAPKVLKSLTATATTAWPHIDYFASSEPPVHQISEAREASISFVGDPLALHERQSITVERINGGTISAGRIRTNRR